MLLVFMGRLEGYDCSLPVLVDSLLGVGVDTIEMLFLLLIIARQIHFICVSDRKYRSGGSLTKIPDNEDTATTLGYPKAEAVKHLPLDMIPHVPQRGEDFGECLPFAVAEEPTDILKEENWGSLSPRNSGNLPENLSTRVVKSSTFARCGETWARESSSENGVIWDGTRLDCLNVALLKGDMRESASVDCGCVGANVVGPDASEPSSLKSEVDAPDPRAEADKVNHATPLDSVSSCP